MVENTRTTWDFRALTHNQQALLTFAGWSIGCGRVQPSKRTVAKLIERGLLTPRDVVDRVGGGLTMRVREYDVPMAAHIAWCAWCSKNHRRGDGS